MTIEQWNKLCALVEGRYSGDALCGFIIDSPWLPGWYGISNIDYYGSERKWMAANKKAIEQFPEAMFLPGFWSEYGMCTEPSAFGAKCIWTRDQLPHAETIISDVSRIADLQVPNPQTDGLLPFMIQRLESMQPEIQDMGHELKFAVARGPLNIASFLMGTSELMLAIMLQPSEIHQLMRVITDFTMGWLRHQKEHFPSIEGILLLDDIVGFIPEEEVRTFAVPYIREIFGAFDTKVRFFHNDADGLVSTPYIKDMGVNLYNFSFEHSINLIRELAGDDVALLGNLPPRDVLAAGKVADVRRETNKMISEVEDKSRMIWSCGGGMSQNVPTENIQAFIETVKAATS